MTALTTHIAGPLFTRPEPREAFADLERALLADVPRKNSWKLADRMQELLYGPDSGTSARWLLVRFTLGEPEVMSTVAMGSSPPGSAFTSMTSKRRMN
ncbi:hypothetical protein ACIHFD_04735 [Nonomuraea sp. NPDC051941]|uniref:hypothetical protein n=1 Tax=Nonomuraea sp. NPDC051941 TaxID=3364373 RepID=UPI0037C755D2